MSNNPLIMGYGGGDVTAAGCRGRWSGHCAQPMSLCVQAVGCGLTVQFSDGKRIRGVQYMVCAIQIDVLTFFLVIVYFYYLLLFL